MLWLTSLVAAVAMGGAQGNESLLARLAPTPTGVNGYEDYLRAGDLVGPSLWNEYSDWLTYKQSQYLNAKLTANRGDPDSEVRTPTIPPGVTPDMPDLEIRKAANDRLGGVIDIIRIGNEKRTYDPRITYGIATLFPELSRFKTLGRIVANRAHVNFAEGRATEAAKDLLDGVVFSRRIFGSNLISSLVSVSVQSIMLAEFQEHLGQLSLYDAKLIDKRCKELIDEPLPVADIYRNEFTMLKNSLDKIFDDPNGVLQDTEQAQLGPAIKGLGPEDRQQLKDLLTQSLQLRFNEEATRMDGPESGWLIRDSSVDPTPSKNDKSVSNLALALLNDLHGKRSLVQFISALCKARVQLRLLRLHARVLEYHWANNRWPTKMEEFADEATAFDPFAQAPFHYELKDGGYRLYSLGIPGLGPIELKYHPISMPQAGGSDHPA